MWPHKAGFSDKLKIFLKNEIVQIDEQSKIEPKIKMSELNSLPKGTIIMWSGSIETIPYSFALCDGDSGTVDLRNRFVVCVGSEYAVNDTGGNETHIHNVPSNSGGPSGSNPDLAAIQDNPAFTDSASNIPPFYALCYIQKMFNGSFRVISGHGEPVDDPATDSAIYYDLDNGGETWVWDDDNTQWI